MAGIKIKSLIKGCSKSELADIKQAIALDASKNSIVLLNLLAEVSESESETSEFKKRVFKEIFSNEYSKEKDYLLRNEYRILLARLRILIPTLFCKKELNSLILQSGLFVDWLKQKGLIELAEEELAEEYRKYKKSNDSKPLLRVQDQIGNLRVHYLTQTRFSCETQINDSLERIEQLKIHALEEIRREEIRLKHAERVLLSYDKKYVPLPYETTIDLEQLTLKSELAKYLHLRAIANVSTGKTKIDSLMELISNQDQIKRFEPKPGESLCRILINLALCHYLEGNYTKAAHYFGEAYLNVDEIEGPVREVLIYDYAFCLIKEGDFALAKKLAEKHKKELSNSNILGKKASLIFIMIYLFVNDTDNAIKFIDLSDKQESPEFHYSMRLAMSAIHYRKGKLEEAIRECVNVDQALNYVLRKDENAQIRQIKECSLTFQRFFRLQAEAANKKELKLGLTKILQDLSLVSSKEGYATMYGSVHSIWVAHEANQLLNA
jgi:hypothetical protein